MSRIVKDLNDVDISNIKINKFNMNQLKQDDKILSDMDVYKVEKHKTEEHEVKELLNSKSLKNKFGIKNILQRLKKRNWICWFDQNFGKQDWLKNTKIEIKNNLNTIKVILVISVILSDGIGTGIDNQKLLSIGQYLLAI